MGDELKVNFVTYGSGYCDFCMRDENLVIVGHSSECVGICKNCLEPTIDQMRSVGALLKFKQVQED